MTPKPAPLSTADFVRTPEAVRAEGSPQEREEALVRDDANQPIEQVAALDATVQRRAAAVRADQPTALFPDTDAADFRRRWTEVQTSFVDEPRHAVEQADELVAGVMKRLAESFASERANLEHQWDRGEDITTEDLRVVMQRYRSFFDRLLSI
jgi:hypothetical protein